MLIHRPAGSCDDSSVSRPWGTCHHQAATSGPASAFPEAGQAKARRTAEGRRGAESSRERHRLGAGGVPGREAGAGPKAALPTLEDRSTPSPWAL